MGKITVNGEIQDLESSTPLPEFITANKVIQPDMVSVQINGEFIARGDFEQTVVKDGDTIDFLYFMGGGEK